MNFTAETKEKIIAVFDENYITPKERRCFDCYKCRNNNKEHSERKNFLKKDGVVCYDNFNLNKYFGRHKGFKFEKITEEEFEKMKEE